MMNKIYIINLMHGQKTQWKNLTNTSVMIKWHGYIHNITFLWYWLLINLKTLTVHLTLVKMHF